MPGLPVPETIGRFKIEARLGSGGMGDVYRGVDPTLRRTVAIKTVRPDIENPMYLERLYREAQAIAQLQHPHIVTVFEAGETSGLVYIAMEFLKGENLATTLDRGDLTFEGKIKALMQILDALQYAHSQGVIHRDIKPANIHRMPDGTIKLLDFGLARMESAQSLTQTGAVMGTPYYASPEQLKAEAIDGRTDVYSTGVVAYEMFTGRRAFDGDNLSTVILKVLTTPPPPMETSWASTFPEIEKIVSRAVAKNAADRYATADDMRNALSAFLANSREGIASVQAEQTIVAQRAVQEARTLISSGALTEARDLLAQTLKSHPDAAAARTLLKETAANAQPAFAVAGVAVLPTIPVPPPDFAGPDVATFVRPPSPASATATVQAPVRVSPPPSPLLPPPPAVADVPAARGTASSRSASRRTAGLIAVGVAVAIAAGGGWMITRNRARSQSQSQVQLQTQTQAPSQAGVVPAPSPALQPAPSAAPAAAPAPAVAPASVGKNAAVTPATSDPNAAAARAKSVEAPASPSSPGAAPAAAEASAKQLFDGGARNAGLRYGVVQQGSDGAEREVDPETTFHSGDRVRFMFEPNIDGFLYVVQEGSTGKWNMLFPSPQINAGVNAVQRGQKIAIPSQGWFRFDNSAGTERAFVFLSKEPMNSLPGFNEPVTKMESVGASVVDDLKRTVRSRDLIFEKEPAAPGAKRQATFVVNRDELGKFVSATIQLIHQ